MTASRVGGVLAEKGGRVGLNVRSKTGVESLFVMHAHVFLLVMYL